MPPPPIVYFSQLFGAGHSKHLSKSFCVCVFLKCFCKILMQNWSKIMQKAHNFGLFPNTGLLNIAGVNFINCFCALRPLRLAQTAETGRPKINNQTAKPNCLIWPYIRKLKFSISYIIYGQTAILHTWPQDHLIPMSTIFAIILSKMFIPKLCLCFRQIFCGDILGRYYSRTLIYCAGTILWYTVQELYFDILYRNCTLI